MQKINYARRQKTNTILKSMFIMMLFSIFMFAKTATATHYRYGNISWSRANDVTRTVSFTVNMSFRKSFYGTPVVGGTVSTGIPFLFGDGTQTPINLLVTSINNVEDWFYGTFTVTKTYAGVATAFTASFTSCCRISSLSNNNDQTFGSQSFVKLLPGSTSAPLSTMPPIINLAIGNPAASFTIPAYDPDGTTLTYTLATPAEAANGGSMIHPVGLSVNASTGIGTFSTVGKTVGQLFNTAVTITDASGAKTVVDFMIRMVATSTPPVFDYAVMPLNGAVYSINPGQSLLFNLRATDVDLGDNVTLSAVGLTSGMSFSPALPTSGNPVLSSFSWTPTVGQLGVFIINFTAQDLVGTQVQSSVTINVNMNPIFVAPTPTLSSVRYLEVGNSVMDDIAATNPNPLVNTQLFSAVLPSGATLTNSLPTALASTATTSMNWTPLPSNWGVNTFTYVAKDANGKIANHSYDIIANSTPVFTSTPITTAIVNQLYSYTLTASDADLLFGDDLEIENHNPSAMPAWLTFTDNGNGTATLSGTPTMADLGSSNLEFLAADLYHHDHVDVEQIFTLTVIGVAPSIVCPSTISVSNDAGLCSAIANFVATETTGMPASTITYSIASGSTFNVGITQVTATATNAVGSSSCTFDVVVNDTEMPSISCPANVHEYATSSTGASVMFTDPVGIDNCASNTTMTVGLASGSQFPIGITPVTFEVLDASGNAASCSFDVEVEGIAPQIVCPSNISLSASAGNCSEIANYMATENTGIPASTISYSIASGSSFNVGTTQVTATATNAVGSSSCTFDVTITDNENPSINCPSSITLTADANTCGSSNVLLGSASASDNCAIATVTNNAPAFYPVGTTTVTWTALDIHGNSSTCTQDVTVIDNENPSISCPSSVTYTADANSCGSANVVLGTPTTNDNCGVASTSNDGLAFYPVGTTTVTWTVTDVHGNSTSCTQDVVVTDNENPSISCPSSVTFTADANACGSANVVLGTPTTNDNCGVASTSNDGFAFYPVGTTTVTWTVTDVHGNSSTCTQDVTVTDNENPNAVCQNYSVNLLNGLATITAADLNNGSTDNCGISSLAISQSNFDCSNVGSNTIVFTVTDIHGNSSTCNSVVTVNDNTAPVAICKNATVTLSNGIASVGSIDLNNNSTDECGIASYTLSQSNFDCTMIGANPVIMTVTDVNGNSSSCTSNVEVVGTIPTMSITEDLLPDFCTGQYKILTANSSDATSFVWNTSETSNPINVSTSGIYSVIGTNVYGCTNAASINTNVNLQSLTSSYVIIAKKEMKLQNNSTVNNGGVGVTTAGKSAKVLANSKVIAAGTFVKATNITVSGNSTVTNKTFSNAVVSLPTFYPNTLTNNTTTNIPNNANITLNGSNYGKINIGTNATVTFTNADVNIRELKSNNNAKIKFNGCTNLHIKYDMELGDNNKFNVAGHKVTVYVGSVSTSGHCGSHNNYGDVEIGKGDSVFANIYAPYGEIEVEGDGNDDDDDHDHGSCNNNGYTILKGQFIAEEFEAKSTKVYWNDFCTPCAGMKSSNNDDESLIATIAEMNVTVYPNPSNNVFTVSIESDNTQNCEMKIIDMTGRVIETLQNLEPNHKYTIGNNLSVGNYILSIKQGDKMQTVKFVKIN